MRLVKYDNKLVVVNGNALEISDNSYIVITTNKKLATLTCGSQSYTLTGDDLSHAFPVDAGTYTCTATLDETTKSTTVTVTTPTVYNASISLTSVPIEYQEVEYIQSTGTQYIDTGYYPNGAGFLAKGKMRWSGTQSSWASVLGGGHSGSGADGKACKFGRYSSTNYWSATLGSDMYSTEVSWSTGVDYEFEVSWYSGNKYLKIGTTQVLSSTDTTEIFDNVTVLLFTYNRTQTLTTESMKGRFYYCEIYDENEDLVRRFIPCYRKSDNEVGMYDTVTDTFYLNSGTGVFTAGPDVN